MQKNSAVIGELKRELRAVADSEKAVFLQRYFKTGKGEYGEGDLFLGVTVPQCRKISKKYCVMVDDVQVLLDSKYHEERLVALLILVERFQKSEREIDREKIVRLYLANSKRINNWDLVDLSAPNILGAFFATKSDRSILYLLAKSDNLWEQRMAIISMMHFIKNRDFADALKISEILIRRDDHDLINKAVGWMLREIGKRDLEVEEAFINHHLAMPPTALRYAIERFPEQKRLAYLEKRRQLAESR